MWKMSKIHPSIHPPFPNSVAKEAAHRVIVDDDFSTIVNALCLCNNAHITDEGENLGQPTEMKRIVESGFSSDKKRMKITYLETE